MIERVAWRVPGAVGVKVIATEQLEEAARVAPQVLLVIAKSPVLVPEIAMLPMLICDVPIFDRVMDCGAPCEPRATSPHVRLRGSIRTPATRQPARLTAMRETNRTNDRLSAAVQQTLRRLFMLRVNVPSSSFILLGVKRM